MSTITSFYGSAVARTFGFYELHEDILSRLPPRELLCSREVSSYWDSLLLESSRLRQCLFLEASTPTTTWILRCEPIMLYGRCSDLSKITDIDPVPAAEVGAATLHNRDETRIVARPNSAMFNKDLLVHFKNDILRRAGYGQRMSLVLRDGRLIEFSDSWMMRMFPTQPPAKTVAVAATQSSAPDLPPYRTVVRREEGVRYADVVDSIRPGVAAVGRACGTAGVILTFGGMVFATEAEEKEAVARSRSGDEDEEYTVFLRGCEGTAA